MFLRVCKSLLPVVSKPSIIRNSLSQQIVKHSTTVFPKHVENYQEELPSPKEISLIRKETIAKVNELVHKGEEGRLFAVVHICGKQFKITTEDIIIVEGSWPPQNSDEIKFEKVLLVGGLNFTLVGTPVVPPHLVTVKGTIIEKDLSHTKPIFYKKRRKQYMRLNFYRSHLTMIRINEITINGDIDKKEDIVQYERF